MLCFHWGVDEPASNVSGDGGLSEARDAASIGASLGGSAYSVDEPRRGGGHQQKGVVAAALPLLLLTMPNSNSAYCKR